MALHVFTQEEFNAIPRDEYGWKNCPSGDYTKIKNFPNRCVFERCSIFGSDAVFGNECRLGHYCYLGDGCRLGDYCYLGDGCRLGDKCRLGDECRLGHYCYLGDGCRLGYYCYLGDGCLLGDYCYLGDGCRLGYQCSYGENVSFEDGNVCGKNVRMLRISRIGSRKDCTYFWKHDGGIYVRCGCFSGGIDAFAEKVEGTHAENQQYLKEYRGAIQYAKTVFGVEETSWN